MTDAQPLSVIIDNHQRTVEAEGDFVRLDEGFHSIEERRRAIRTGACQRLSKKQRAATPEPFRDLLLSIARSPLSSKVAA